MQPDNRFVDLAPTSDADETGIYSAALNAAMERDSVLNIALTGPYGSGKSSVIKSFLLKYQGTPLQLSLASFLPEGEASGKPVSKQEIERSILQQILYGADADRLPHSRFKRIQTPSRWSIFNSLAICLGIFCVWYLFTKQSDVLSGEFFKPFAFSNWTNLLAVSVGAICLWRLVHSVYVKSFGVSLKSVSLKDIQIAPNVADQESILNRHLDEIIYFFQSTKYDLVVIEDLDRFENADIFVTLREINGLVNANAGINRRIRFLYALRDDIFVNTDRTKFFEFIVPVIPIINHSNSVDKVLAHIQRIKLDDRLDRGFVRDVSRYLGDLRLIGNIFNEYVIYSSNLDSDGENILDPNKLLAILIYKNVMPKDFAALHRQEGALTKILGRYNEFVAKAAGNIQSQLAIIQTDLKNSEAQSVRDVVDLRRIYAMAIIERVPANFTNLKTEFGRVTLGEMAAHPEFEKILSMSSATVSDRHGYQDGVQINGVEAAVDPTMTFAARKSAIERKSIEGRDKLSKETQLLKRELSSLRAKKFNEVLRESAELVEEVFAEVGENRDLLKFLILEGYLDDTYYQYISLFHGERLSPNDNKFLIQIRSYNNPDPEFPLDNVSEVIASMREDDFGSRYVLNRHIIDQLFQDAHKNFTRLAAAVEFISTHFSDCDDFFSSYYSRGNLVDILVSTLIAKWPSFPATALKSAHGASHAARILAHAPDAFFDTKNPSNFELSRYLSTNLGMVLHESVDFDLERLKKIELRVAEISTIADFGEVLSFIAAERLYTISIDNIRHVMEHVVRYPAVDDLRTLHFTSLRKSDDKVLLSYVDANFETYLNNVLLLSASNTEEDTSAIIDVLCHEEVEFERRAEFLAMQSAIFQSFEGIPTAFHALLLKAQKIEGNWHNCMIYLSSEVFNTEVLTTYLQGREAADILSKKQIPDGKDWFKLRQFLIENDELGDNVYRSYVCNLPRPFTSLPALGLGKIEILIKEQKIIFSKENYEKIEHESLQLLFIATNFDTYWSKREDYVIDNAFRGKLLHTSISDAQKLKVISEIDPIFVSSNTPVAAFIAAILNRLPITPSNYGADFIKAVILNSRSGEPQISLLNKLHGELSVVEVRAVIRELPSPYGDIGILGRYPKIEKSETNAHFASWLKERNLISSFKATVLGDLIQINTFKKE